MSRISELIQFAREHSAYYADLYQDIPKACSELSQYPQVDQQRFWSANEDFGKGILTTEHESGIVFKSGGTSGNPKYSFFTAKEWDSFTEVSGRGFHHNGVKKGDRIANLFYAGELYASFIYVSDLIKSADIGVNYPIGGQTPIEEIVQMLSKLRINVIAGVPTTVMNILEYLNNHPQYQPNIELILFGGESFYPDQLEAIARVFPQAKVHSILYASVDGGELGYFDALTCKNGEHRCFDESTIMEIVDEESGALISEINQTGKLLVTNLNRRLMPLIRYPVGDLALWCEPEGTPNRKFRLVGRSQEGARIGPATLYVQDILSVLEHFKDEVSILNFQILITHDTQKDRAVIKAVAEQMPHDAQALSDAIIAHLYDERSMFKALLENKIIHPISLIWSRSDELESNPRTGKTKHILDHRLEP